MLLKAETWLELLFSINKIPVCVYVIARSYLFIIIIHYLENGMHNSL